MTAIPWRCPPIAAMPSSSIAHKRSFGRNPSGLDALGEIFRLIAIEQRFVDRNHGDGVDDGQ